MQQPLGLASLGLTLVGAVVGYVLTMLGITLYFNLNGLGDAITTVDSFIVIATGVVCLVAGYAGWRGFMTFAY
ncbi:hypothetical protein AUR64_09960 [Haloprofundus marisrubri]|uniref:Uncharacterized protein n=1 Tax=Haloprofundus marisrubri TaxID=1514971 RepID=A0A0W1R951_9EURY|nr:hypothetical protein [Haloprofundus marisrubri]KTG09937.1 hypothetical protein AUR64_09960 [Haloprofundus marisrubri]